jgi:hypothetical protein
MPYSIVMSSLKGQCHEIFESGFFHGSVFLKPLSIPLGPFRIFSLILNDTNAIFRGLREDDS